MSSVFDPGKGDRETAQQQADDAIIGGVSSTGPGGITTGFNFEDGEGSSEFGLGDFDPTLKGLQGLSQFGINQAQGGGITADMLRNIDQNRLQQGQDFAGLGDIFQNALGVAKQDPFDLGEDISSRLRQLSERRNQRSVNKLFDRLQRPA